jgi:hypothetical protein
MNLQAVPTTQPVRVSIIPHHHLCPALRRLPMLLIAAFNDATTEAGRDGAPAITVSDQIRNEPGKEIEEPAAVTPVANHLLHRLLHRRRNRDWDQRSAALIQAMAHDMRC